METNWIICSAVVVLALLLVLYLIWQNRKDRQTFEREANLQRPGGESELNDGGGPY